jgi:hypothetical protein
MGYIGSKRSTYFNEVRIESFEDSHPQLCLSHRFYFDKNEESKKLYDGQPCFYTDDRFTQGNNWYKMTAFPLGKPEISLKSAIRLVNSYRNIPEGTVVSFYINGLGILYEYRVKNSKTFIPDYTLSKDYLLVPTDSWMKELTLALRENGFIVRIRENLNFLVESPDDFAKGEIALAHGHGKVIGFSKGNFDYRGYQNGCGHILWDKFGEFDKWSRAKEIKKSTSIQEIISTLTNQ